MIIKQSLVFLSFFFKLEQIEKVKNTKNNELKGQKFKKKIFLKLINLYRKNIGGTKVNWL